VDSEEKTRLRELQARARTLGLKVTTMPKNEGYWIIDARNTVRPGAKELTLEQVEGYFHEEQRNANASEKKR
jgi:hypothetical protein